MKSEFSQKTMHGIARFGPYLHGMTIAVYCWQIEPGLGRDTLTSNVN